jgi:hypothetical protein
LIAPTDTTRPPAYVNSDYGIAVIGYGGEPMRIETSDLAILPLGAGHVLGSEPGLKPTPIEEALGRGA